MCNEKKLIISRLWFSKVVVFLSQILILRFFSSVFYSKCVCSYKTTISAIFICWYKSISWYTLLLTYYWMQYILEINVSFSSEIHFFVVVTVIIMGNLIWRNLKKKEIMEVFFPKGKWKMENGNFLNFENKIKSTVSDIRSLFIFFLAFIFSWIFFILLHIFFSFYSCLPM